LIKAGTAPVQCNLFTRICLLIREPENSSHFHQEATITPDHHVLPLKRDYKKGVWCLKYEMVRKTRQKRANLRVLSLKALIIG